MMLEGKIPSGMYVVAVSGGVDSMVLLDMMRRLAGTTVVVAHVDHGMRSDSRLDRMLVQRYTMSHNLALEYTELHLGVGTDEATARQERYKFLRHMRKKYNASAIVTAHHRDDVLETAIMNLLRGTGWRGLSSLRSQVGLLRPLLDVPKANLLQYAAEHHLMWREDSTNQDQRYRRNYVRHTVLTQCDEQQKDMLYRYIVRQNFLTDLIDHEIDTWLTDYAPSATSTSLPRYQLCMLPCDVAHELLQAVLRRCRGKSTPRPLIERALLYCKVAKPGKIFQLDAHWQIRTSTAQVIVEPAPDMVS